LSTINSLLPLLIIYFREYGLWLLSTTIILQCNGIPTGANLLVMAAGAFAYACEFNLISLGITVYISNILGDLSSYYVWRYLGSWIWQRFPRLQRRVDPGLSKVGTSLERYGFLTVVLTRFPLSAFALVTNILAGMTGYKLSRFFTAVAIGELMWSIFNLAVGYWFGDSWETAGSFLSQFSAWVLLVAALIIVFCLAFKQIKKAKQHGI
jgi:membrane-associated protein